MDEAIKAAIDYASKLGVVSCLLLFIYAIVKPGTKWLVPASFYDDACKERDQWKKIALQAHGVAIDATNALPAILQATPKKD